MEGGCVDGLCYAMVGWVSFLRVTDRGVELDILQTPYAQVVSHTKHEHNTSPTTSYYHHNY